MLVTKFLLGNAGLFRIADHPFRASTLHFLPLFDMAFQFWMLLALLD